MVDLTLLEEKTLLPSHAVIEDIAKIEGDILLLGVGGKMGPSMAKLARQAADAAGVKKRVIGVSRFSAAATQRDLEAHGVETIAADLLSETDLAALPDVSNIIYLVGHKFGTTGKEPFTWAMNTYLPGRVAARFTGSRIVAFSTGNVYPLTAVGGGGATEADAPEPIGEYAQSCLGRERVFQYFSSEYGVPMFIYRLNYAVDFRYGVLTEVAKSVLEGRPVDLTMGVVNVIWQGDANEIAIRALKHCTTPAKVLNITGPETVSVKWLAEEFGKLVGKQPQFINTPGDTALLSNSAEAHKLFGYPRVSLKQMMELTVQWITNGGESLAKPTRFQERTGKY